MAQVLDFGAHGAVTADAELQPLSAINAVLRRLQHVQVPCLWRCDPGR